MKKKVSISEIARALGVSTTTVSFVLNGKAKEKRLSEALTMRVLEYVKKVGYRPNELAKSLRTGKTKILGLVIEDISNPFFANIARYIETKAYERGYRIIYCSTDNDLDKTLDFIQLFRDRHVDGYLITPPIGLEDTIADLLSNDLPVVLFDRYLPLLDTDYVIVDNRQGAFDATNHLIDQGYERIGFVNLEAGQSQMQDRRQGYIDALATRGLDSYIKNIIIEKIDQSNILEFMEFYKQSKLDAVFFAANHLAIIGLKAFKQFGEEIPGVVSYDDHMHFRLSTPTITVVSQPISQIAEEVINVLINNLEGKSISKQKIVLPTQLIVRESSRRQTSWIKN